MAGDGTYVTIAEVRRTAGIDSTAISDSDMGEFIEEWEPQIERELNTSFTPKEEIEFRDGNQTNRLILLKNPLLAVRELKINGTTEDPANLDIYKQSGKIVLNTSATTSNFQIGTSRVRIKYLHGWMEESSTSTTTTSASTAGTSVALAVAVSDASAYTTGSWVEVYSMDGKREVAQITGDDTNEITVDQLVQTHESGSKVVLLQTPEIFKKLIRVGCAIAAVIRVVGESADDITGYTIAEFQVQKGEPFTQWRETILRLIEERDRLLGTSKLQGILKPRPAVM